MHSNLTSRIAGYSSVIAGALHLSIVALLHWSPFPPLEGIFFIVCGLMQIIVGTTFLSHPTLSLYHKGLLLNGGMATLYVLMQFLPVPFMGEPETLELLGVAVMTIEVIAVGASLYWILTHDEHSKRHTLTMAFLMALVITVFSGFGMYGGAQSMASMLPNRHIQHSHDSTHPHMNSSSHASHSGSTLSKPMNDVHGDDSDEHHDSENTQDHGHNNEAGDMPLSFLNK